MKSIRSSIKSLKYLLSLCIFFVIGLICHCSAQNNEKADSSHFDSLIKKISILNHFDLKQYDKLTVINEDTGFARLYGSKDTSDNKAFFKWSGRRNEDMLIGWVIRTSKDSIYFLESSGIEIGFKNERVKRIRTVLINDSLTELLNDYCKSSFTRMCYWYYHSAYAGDYVMPYYLVSLWLYQKGYNQPAYKLLQQIRKEYDSYDCKSGYKDLPLDVTIERNFGNLYYNKMLVAYSIDRDYAKAIQYGSYFNNTDYIDFLYTRTAIELTEQLKQRKDDFKWFCIPDSLSWIRMKSTMDRNEQLIYLTERIRLLRCCMHGQPDDINFHDAQYVLITDSMKRDNIKYSDWRKYKVINPYNEILAMNPKVSEVETFLPYLNDTSYIPTYWYWRDFNFGRKVYRFNEVIESIIFNITGEHLIAIDSFNLLSATKKKIEIEKIRNWCSKYNTLSKEELNRIVLSETNYWDAFEKALDSAVVAGDTSIIKILIRRNNDTFSGYRGMLSAYKWRIVQAIYSLGSAKDTAIMKAWYKTDKDDLVKMWTSLFLMKYDKAFFETAFDTLNSVMSQNCVYQYAIKPLLSFKSERTLKLAEGLFTTGCFQANSFNFDYPVQIKLLLLAKSEVAFKFLYDGLMNFGISNSWQNKACQRLYCETYMEVVDKWRAGKKHYDYHWNKQKMRRYSKDLAQWLTKQFELICADKKNDIIIEKSDAW